ncbi:hypothetical protein CBR_g21876 [Chara braunii]|uniref:Topo IA-type catalytic domain-containing protein n=1 Tax=Chara braunii TaxID=69332 RepID=A0A388L1K2_CHABU|nr:hypothetical protein CBR_g21876 [Chara braunii]|eukprot:GBG76128.1 hypothetical protein CBR_g21876 [Chara braunii]
MRSATESEIGGGDNWRLYDYVTRNFIASFSPDCKFTRTNVSFTVGGEVFSCSGRSVTSPGFTAVMPWGAIRDEGLPDFNQGETARLAEIELHQGRTSPPDYLSESELISLMEKNGIGTDASIPTHINNICERNYAQRVSQSVEWAGLSGEEWDCFVVHLDTMDDYPMYGLLMGFSLWGTLWRLLFPLGFWHTIACRVETRSGAGTTPYTQAQEEEAAKILAEQKARKEKKELVKQAKKIALQQEQAAKMKKLQEEMERVKEEEEKMKAVDTEEVKEEKEKQAEAEDIPLISRSVRERGESSGTKGDPWIEKKVTEWVANLSLGETEEAMLYVPLDEQEAVIKEIEAEADPLKCQTIEEEKKLEWRLRAKLAAPKEEERCPCREPVKVKFPDPYSGKREENFNNWEANVNLYVHLQMISPEEQVLIAFHALARSLCRAANCNNDMVAYSQFTPLIDFFKLLRERFADVTRSIRASDKLQTIHTRHWKSARALKGVMDELVAVPEHGVTETQLVNLFYRAMPESLHGRFFEKSRDPAMTYDTLSREVVAFEVRSMPVTTFWHKDLDKGKKWKGRTISGQVKGKDHLILTLDEGDMEEVPYDQIEWGLEEEEVDSSASQGRTYAAVAAGGRPQGRGGGRGQGGQASGGRGLGDQGVGGRGNRQAGGRGQGPSQNCSSYNRSSYGRGGWHPGLPQGRPWEDLGLEQSVLEKLREANFKINAKKCEWAKTQVLYLGHVLDGDGIKPEDSKKAAIRDWSTPRTLTELRSFLGLANYYRKFVRNFSTIVAPLRRLLKKETIWCWDKDCTSALKKLKRALIEYPILKVADPSLPFVVTIDASQYGIGAVLQQDDGNGYRPVEFMSARMPSEKVATSTYERELYALRQALEHWKHYLLGRHFKVYSDHETLRWSKTQAKMTPKLTRWAAEIDQYDFELKPMKGKYNVVADALSRRVDYFGAIVHYLDIGTDLQQRVEEAYVQDPIYSDLLKRVKEAPETEPHYRTTDGLLFEKTNVVDRLCIPYSEEIRSLILGEYHDTERHFGWQKTLANLSCAYTWPGMKVDYIEPGDSVSIDFMDTGVKSRHGKSQVMVVVDRFSKSPRLKWAEGKLAVSGRVSRRP